MIPRRDVPAHGEPGFRFFEKQLSPADVTINALVLPAGAEHVLPPLDIAAYQYQTARLVDVKDLRGKRFEFRYIWGRRRRRHMLGDHGVNDNEGWRGFVKAKRLATMDTVVFMRRPAGGGGGGGEGVLLVGVRRAPHVHYSRPGVERNKVVFEVCLAMQGVTAFEVTYYTRQGTFEFVVWRDEYFGFYFSAFRGRRLIGIMRPPRSPTRYTDKLILGKSYVSHQRLLRLRVLRHAPPASRARSRRRGQREFCFFDKKLLESDVTANGGGSALIVIPKSSAAEHEQVLPPIPDLRVTDLHGGRWEFGHTWSDTDTERSHTLAAGWSAFIKAKRLFVGDTVIFMRRPGGELLVGVRRNTYGGMPVGIPDKHVAGRRVLRDVGPRHPFRATYCPWQGTAEFVVRRDEVEGSPSLISLTPGTRVRLLMNPDDARRRMTQAVHGAVRDVYSRSAWCMLEVSILGKSNPFSSLLHYRVLMRRQQLHRLCSPEMPPRLLHRCAASSDNGVLFFIVNPQDGSQANNSASHQ
uniref:Auxin response factor n=1 Tax=Oryza punctata TaxID=4537 RepID=A0A0E0MG23_ORYPU